MPQPIEQGRVARRRARVRAALLDAARQALTTRGYREATIAEIVQLADIATGTFYLHFRDKDDLFTAVVEEELHTIFGQIRTALVDVPAEDVIPCVIRVTLAQAYQQRAIFLFACTEGNFAHALMSGAQAHLTDLLLPALQAAQARGQLGTMESTLLAHLITGMVVQGISWWFEQNEPGPEVMAESILFLLTRGLPSSFLPSQEKEDLE